MATTNKKAPNKDVRAYLKKIGKVGGKKSKRNLSQSQAREMVAVRLGRKALSEHYYECFWSYPKKFNVRIENIGLIIQALKKEGNHVTYEKARRIESLVNNQEETHANR